MTSGNMQQRVFRRMLVREAGTGDNVSAVAAATRRLCERLSQQMAPLLGDAGAAAIYARSLHLTERQVPGLAPIRASSKEEHGPFTRVQHFIEHQEPAVAADAAVAVLTTVGDLLTSFIGHNLTIRLLREAWPDDFADGTTEETTT